MKRVNMTNTLPKLGLSVLTAIVLSGCMKLGPDFNGIDNPPIPKEWQKKSTYSDNSMAQWWKIFNDPALDKLVEMSYAQSLNIKSAGLRIAQARAALGIVQGLTFPQVQKVSGLAAYTQKEGREIKTAKSSFDIGWELDIWGKYARNIESSEANFYASVAAYNAVMVSVTSEVARLYIAYRTAEERLAYAIRNVTIQERVIKITEVQFNSGNVSELDMQQARSQLYNTKTVLPSIELAKIQSLNALALLIGTEPKEVKKILKTKSKKQADSISKYIGQGKSGTMQIKHNDKDMLNVAMIPVPRLNPYNKIDAALLKQRPDVKLAEYNVRSNSALIGAKMAELYPSFSLFGNIGYSRHSDIGELISGSDALGVSIGPAFSWNIFQYGRIKNAIRLQDAKFEESLVNYNNKVLTAVTEVNNALSGYVMTKKEQEANKIAVTATVRAFNISIIQYNEGMVGYQRLLTSVEKLTRTQDRYASIKGALAVQAVLFYKALGGGWQISKGKSYLSEETAQKMEERVDWDQYLDPEMTRLPKEML